MQSLPIWIAAHKLWVALGLIAVLGTAGAGIIIADQREKNSQREQQPLAEERPKQRSLPTPGIVHASPTPKPSPAASTPTLSQQSTTPSQASPSHSSEAKSHLSTEITWEFSGSSWQAQGKAPACPDPMKLPLPVDINLATSILYPGQKRGGQYKPHGGFRFDNSVSDAISVKIPLDARLTQGSRYLEAGEVQHLFEFTAPCGIMYRFDHLRVLPQKFADVANKLPEAKSDDSRTTHLEPPVSVTASETLATAVGYAQTNNTFVDWGVYDLRQANQASKNAAFAAEHQTYAALTYYGVCWFDWLSDSDRTKVKSLPAADSVSGATSDYCK